MTPLVGCKAHVRGRLLGLWVSSVLPDALATQLSPQARSTMAQKLQETHPYLDQRAEAVGATALPDAAATTLCH